ncbi:MAG: hypothetical protein H2049_13275 [Porphyrobacter sp.]|nr:hypothetical protein [Porphyrobacter sp.]
MYMNQNSFAHTGAIKELSFNEIDDIAGGPLLAPALYLGGLAVGFGLAVAADYLDGGLDD